MSAVLLLLMAAPLILWVPIIHPCEVTIHPKINTLMFGASLNLSCLVSSCSNYTELRWEVPLPAVTKKGDGWILLYVANVTEWTLPLSCSVNYGDSNQTYTKKVIHVYQFSNPAIYTASDIMSGDLSGRIVCSVSSLKVSGSIPSSINISLSRDGNILSRSSGNTSVEYNFVANLEQDDGAEILCEANLLVGSQVLRKHASRILNVVASPYNVSISTTHTTYRVDAKIVLRCNAKGKPHPEFSWDFPSSADVELSERNKTVTIPSAKDFHNGTYRCRVRNNYGKNSAQIDIVLEGKSRSWVIVPVVVVSVLGLAVIGGILYYCRK